MNNSANKKVLNFTSFKEMKEYESSRTIINSAGAPAASGNPFDQYPGESDGEFDFTTAGPYNRIDEDKIRLSSEEKTMANKEDELTEKVLDLRFASIDEKIKGIEDKVATIAQIYEESKKDNQNLVNMIQSEVHDQNQRMSTIESLYTSILTSNKTIFIAIVLGFIAMIITFVVSK